MNEALMRKTCFSGVIICLVLSPASAGAVVCKAIESTMDYVVCSDSNLAAAYGELENAGAKAAAALDKVQKRQFRQDDLRWWREFGEACGIHNESREPSNEFILEKKGCVLQQITDRIAALHDYSAK